MNHAIASLDLNFDLPQLFQLAQQLIHAQGFIPKHFRHPGEIVAAILTGRELGIPPMAALRGISFVDGRVVLDQALHLSLMIARGVKFRWVSDGSDGTAALELTRPGQEPFVSVYTMDMAKKAGLTGKKNWQSHPAAMLRARAVSAASRAYMPDVLSGVYVPGELDEQLPHGPDVHADALAAAQHVKAGGDVETAPAAGRAPAQLPASTPGAETIAERIARELYAVKSAADLERLRADANATRAGMSRSDRELVKNAITWAAERVVQLDAEAREAGAAEAALSAKVDAAAGGEGADVSDAALDERELHSRAHDEPSANDHEPGIGFGGAEVVQQ